jgi:hypothetical protein
LEDAAQELLVAERKLIAAMQNFVDAQAKAGGSKSRAFDIPRQRLRKTHEEKAKRGRAAFKIVE